MSQYRNEGFEPLFITSVQDWKTLISCDKVKQFVVIDDMFGNTCLDRMKLNEWVSYLGIMEKIVAERKGNLIVACTSRKYIFEDVKSSLAQIGSFNKITVLDLTSQSLKLTRKEKEKIFEKYAVEYQVDDYYPHCVAMFCTNIFLHKAGLSFFKNPTECIRREIHNFRENDRAKYIVLLIKMLNKNKLNVHAIEQICYDSSEATRKLFNAAGMSLDTCQPDICHALESLNNTYLKQDSDGFYHFTHESILENVAQVFIFTNPILAIEMIDLRFLFVQHEKGENVLKFSDLGEKESVPVREGILQPLVRRMTSELGQGNMFNVILCDVWCDHNFVNKWGICSKNYTRKHNFV